MISNLKFQIPLTLAMTAFLSGCGDGETSLSKIRQYEESPRTRFAAVSAHGDYSRLIGELVCDSERGAAFSSFHEAYVEVVPDETQPTYHTMERVRIVIDRASNLALVSIEGGRGVYHHIRRTSIYKIEGQDLVIEGVGKISVDRRGDFSIDRVRGIHPVGLTPRAVGSMFVSDETEFQMLCGGNSNDRGSGRVIFPATSGTRE